MLNNRNDRFLYHAFLLNVGSISYTKKLPTINSVKGSF
jgi:hypothetical protein